jgi:uncharacterized membrane protein YqgA involved in biofilm formation
MYIEFPAPWKNRRVMLLIISMVAGSMIGEWINIDRGMNKLGLWAEKKKSGLGEGGFAKGFVTASICSVQAPWLLLGAMQSGLQGNHEMLLCEIDPGRRGLRHIRIRMGIGVAFSAVPVFLYEGMIALGAGYY